MNKCFKSVPLLLVAVLTACSSSIKAKESRFFCFDTIIETKLYDGTDEDIYSIQNILLSYDSLADSYQDRDIVGVYKINQTNEDISISKELYDLLKTSFDVKKQGATFFNPLLGTLSSKWKEALGKSEPLTNDEILVELNKTNNSDLVFKENNIVQRIGEAELDLGGIAKGYALDKVKSYLQEKELKQYMVNAGSSSILLGEKPSQDGLFTIKIKDLNNAYFKAKDCFVSTSGISEQSITVDNKTYSHIVNPTTGNTVCTNDTVIVVNNNGALGDALSTSLMFYTPEEIEEFETKYSIKTIAIKGGKIVHKHSDIEVIYK